MHRISPQGRTTSIALGPAARVVFPGMLADLGQDRILATTRRRFVFELNRIIDDDFRGPPRALIY